ncbi:MAG: hypothetical protein ABID79_03435 [Elusimicrobiota bacterium]
MKKYISLFICFIHFYFFSDSYLFPENKIITDVKKWEYIETEHFKIYHYSECKELLPTVSSILEETFNNTTRFYEYCPLKKIPFFIYRNHNEFEQTNIVDIGEGTCGVTEALKNRLIVYSNGSIRWLKNVIPHEFTHIIQFTSFYEESLILKALRLARGIFVPLWMLEGMAEYNTGNIDATTREMIIRDMVSSKNVISLKDLSTFNHLKPHQITPAYKLSEMAYHFLVDEYGFDKPSKMLKVLRDKLDANSAFIDTLNITPELFMEKWKEWLYEKYEDKIINFKEASDYALSLTFDNNDNIPDFNTNPAVSPDGKFVVFITDNDGVNKLVITPLSGGRGLSSKDGVLSDGGGGKILLEGNSIDIDVIHNERISFSPNGNLLAFSGEKMQKDYIYIYDIKNKKLSKLPVNIFTVKSPSFSSDGRKMVFIGMEKACNDIYEYDLNNNFVKKITDDTEDQASPSYSPDGNFIVFSQEDLITHQNDIFLFEIKTQIKTRLTNFNGNETEPVFSADGKRIFFVSDKKIGSPINIYSIEINNKEIRKHTNLLTGAFNLCPTSDDKNLLFVNYRNFRKDIYLADISLFENKILENKSEEKSLIELSTSVELPTKNNSLTSPVFPYRFKPSLDILVPFIIYHSEFGLFLATYWQASELLGNHQLYNQLLYSSNSNDLQYIVGYSYLKWRPQLTFSMQGKNSKYLTNSKEMYEEKKHIQSIGINYPLDRFNRLEMAVSTKKYTQENNTSDELTVDQRTNRYSILYDRNTIAGKYFYARFGSNLQLFFRCAFLEYNGNIAYKEYMAKYEKYFPVFSKSAIVLDNLFISNEGTNKQYIRPPLRGFSNSNNLCIYNHFFATTFEYRFPVLTFENIWPMSDFFLKSINVFFFTDNGFGFNETSDCQNITINEIKNSVGSGIHFYTFLGGYLLPITIDYAKRTNDSSDRWNFSLGISFKI